jgi:hypothetical protein
MMGLISRKTNSHTLKALQDAPQAKITARAQYSSCSKDLNRMMPSS